MKRWSINMLFGVLCGFIPVFGDFILKTFFKGNSNADTSSAVGLSVLGAVLLMQFVGMFINRGKGYWSSFVNGVGISFFTVLVFATWVEVRDFGAKRPFSGVWFIYLATFVFLLMPAAFFAIFLRKKKAEVVQPQQDILDDL